jgi:hypothetical protein
MGTGMITKIYIMANSATAGGTFTNLTVRLGNTTLTAFTTGTFVSGLSLAYTAPSTTYPALAAGDWFEITLQTPFLYTSGSNLIVDVSQNGYTGSGIQVRFDGTLAGGRLYGANSGTTGIAAAGPFNLGLNMVPAGPCVNPPTAGTTTVSNTNLCPGSALNLNLSGNTFGSGQSYQWQTGPTAAGPWTNLGAPSIITPYLATTATSTTYYRAGVTCGTATTYSTPVLVTAALFPSGTYTIDKNSPASSTNFVSFGAAVAAISCGTAGPVTFNVVSGSGPYNEQVTISQINTNSATNTITFNGNGNTLTFGATTSTAPNTLSLNGADFIRFNNTNFAATGTSFGFATHLYNGADNNIFTNCTFSVPITATSSSINAFNISGSAASPTTSGLAGSRNELNSCTMTGGYYNTCIYADPSTPATGNKIINCNMRDFYAYGNYMYYTDSLVMSGNNIERPDRTSTTTFYGIYVTSATRALIEKNRVHDAFNNLTTNTNLSYCLYVSGAPTSAAQENRVFNNAVYNINSNGIIYGLYTSGSYIRTLHNTIKLDHSGATTTSATFGHYSYDFSGAGVGVENKNNIIYITRGGAGTKYGFNYWYNVNAQSNNNIIHMGSPAGTNYTGYLYTNTGVTYLTLSDWQTANSSAWDGSSYNTDPVFSNTPLGILKPTNNSLDNKGASMGVTTDLLGFNRASPPDIGAVEFGSDCPMANALASSAVSGTSATISWAAPLGGANGYEYVLNQVSADPATAGTIINTTSLAATNLRPLATYYFHLRVRCPLGGYSYWSTHMFTTPCIIPSANVLLSGDSMLCQNQAITLSTDTAFNSLTTYQWLIGGNPIPGATTTNHSTAMPGTYTLVAIMGACTRTSNPVKLSLDSSLLAFVTYSGTTSICEGGQLLLNASTGSGYSYQWLRNGTPIPAANTSTYSVTYNGNYQVRISRSGLSCSGTSDPLNVSVNNSPVPQVTRSGNMLSTTRPYVTYQWYKGVQAIPGATAPTYMITADGAYSVAVRDSATCAGRSSAYPVNFLSVGGVAKAEDIAIYPNPATDHITISAPTAVNVAIRGVDGRLAGYHNDAKQINISGLAGGVYMLTITDKNGLILKTEKLIKAAR